MSPLERFQRYRPPPIRPATNDTQPIPPLAFQSNSLFSRISIYSKSASPLELPVWEPLDVGILSSRDRLKRICERSRRKFIGLTGELGAYNSEYSRKGRSTQDCVAKKPSKVAGPEFTRRHRKVGTKRHEFALWACFALPQLRQRAFEKSSDHFHRIASSRGCF